MTRPITVPLATRPARNTYADLLRAVSIISVVIGHWLLTGVVTRQGRLVGVNALGVVHWGAWVTLAMQVVPLFFLVGGYANAASWGRHQAAGQEWPLWVQTRVMRLLVPTCGYAALIVAGVLGAQLAGIDPRTVATAGWAVALHLWFLAVYAVVLFCTPALWAAHQRWGLRVPAAMVVLAVVIDAGVVGLHWPLVGGVNYLLVWGTFHQLGFAWQDGSLVARVRPAMLAGGAALVLIGLIWAGPYPVSMIGAPGARIQNASPPSSALLAFGIAQCGVALACEPRVTRWLAQHARSRARIATAGALTMPVYLWHMVPVVIVIEAGYRQLIGLPAIGSSDWWYQRVVWIFVLGVALAAVLAVLAGLSRASHRHRPPVDGGSASPDRPPPHVLIGLLLLGVVAAAAGIGQLAASGFAPHGHLAAAPLAELVLGLICVGGSAHRQRLSFEPANR